MSHADLVVIIWGGLGALVVIGLTVTGVFHAMYDSEEDDNV